MAIVLAVVLLTSAIYLGSPAIADWMQRVGAGAEAASPSPDGPTPAPTLATPTPTLTTPAASRQATSAPSPPTTPTPTQAGTPFVHVVVRGETLIALAARYGVTVDAIKDANGIKDPGLILVGQRLVIPAP